MIQKSLFSEAIPFKLRSLRRVFDKRGLEGNFQLYIFFGFFYEITNSIEV